MIKTTIMISTRVKPADFLVSLLRNAFMKKLLFLSHSAPACLFPRGVRF
jgi:hypothetical protein